MALIKKGKTQQPKLILTGVNFPAYKCNAGNVAGVCCWSQHEHDFFSPVKGDFCFSCSYTKLGYAGNTEPQFIVPSCEYFITRWIPIPATTIMHLWHEEQVFLFWHIYLSICPNYLKSNCILSLIKMFDFLLITWGHPSYNLTNVTYLPRQCTWLCEKVYSRCCCLLNSFFSCQVLPSKSQPRLETRPSGGWWRGWMTWISTLETKQ